MARNLNDPIRLKCLYCVMYISLLSEICILLELRMCNGSVSPI